MPMLPSPTTNARYLFFGISASSDLHHVPRSRGFLRRKRRFERRHGVLGRTDLGHSPGERAAREIHELLAKSAAAGAVVHRPIGRIRAVEFGVVGDAEVWKGVLHLDETFGADDVHALFDIVG